MAILKLQTSYDESEDCRGDGEAVIKGIDTPNKAVMGDSEV